MNKKLRTTLVWALCLSLFVLVFQLLTGPSSLRLGFEDFSADADSGMISRVWIDGNEITVARFDGLEYTTLGVVSEELTQQLSTQGVEVGYGERPQPMRKLLMILLPLVLLLGLFAFFLKKAQGGTTNVLSMRKSTARSIVDSKVRFDDVGGCEEAKEQLRDVIDFLEHPEHWTNAGLRLPRGVLLEGPPGCGKTLMARAVAGESDASFYLVSASEFVEMFVGVGASRVRDTFETAAKNAPAVVFIDEIDAVGRRRGSGIGASNDEREQTLNQILVCLDGFEENQRVVVIAATNRADVLDAALLRPGRFDRRVEIPPLDLNQREQVLSIHCNGKPLGSDVDLRAIALRTDKLSGADLENLANEAGLLAVRRTRTQEDSQAEIRSADFETALATRRPENLRFDCVDAVLVESTTQLAHPTGRASVRLTLFDSTVIEGELAWADAAYLKLRDAQSGEDVVIPKHQVKTVESLEGTEMAGADLAPDTLAGRLPNTA